MDSETFALVLAAIPALAALLTSLFPPSDRGSLRKVQRRAELIKSLPKGEGRLALERALDAHAQSLAYFDDRRLRRVVDWSSVATIVLLLALTTVATVFLWPIEIWIVRAAVLALDIFVALLLLAGFSQIYRYDLGYRHEVQKEKSDKAAEKQARREAERMARKRGE